MSNFFRLWHLVSISAPSSQVSIRLPTGLKHETKTSDWLQEILRDCLLVSHSTNPTQVGVIQFRKFLTFARTYVELTGVQSVSRVLTSDGEMEHN